jgi:hypothetical protein
MEANRKVIESNSEWKQYSPARAAPLRCDQKRGAVAEKTDRDLFPEIFPPIILQVLLRENLRLYCAHRAMNNRLFMYAEK